MSRLLWGILLSLLWQSAFVLWEVELRQSESGVGLFLTATTRRVLLTWEPGFRCEIPVQVHEHHNCNVLCTSADFHRLAISGTLFEPVIRSVDFYLTDTT